MAKDATTPDPEVPADPAPEPTPPADPPAPPAPEEEAPALCEQCFPWGLPEGYLTAGCEHSG